MFFTLGRVEVVKVIGQVTVENIFFHIGFCQVEHGSDPHRVVAAKGEDMQIFTISVLVMAYAIQPDIWREVGHGAIEGFEFYDAGEQVMGRSVELWYRAMNSGVMGRGHFRRVDLQVEVQVFHDTADVAVSCGCVEAMIDPNDRNVLLELRRKMQKCDSHRAKIGKNNRVLSLLDGEPHDLTGLVVSEL